MRFVLKIESYKTKNLIVDSIETLLIINNLRVLGQNALIRYWTLRNYAKPEKNIVFALIIILQK